jgi:hypothetical protein
MVELPLVELGEDGERENIERSRFRDRQAT